MFPPNKKPGMSVMIAIGKPKGRGDEGPEAPEPLDKKREAAPMPREEDEGVEAEPEPEMEAPTFDTLADEIGTDPDTAKQIFKQCLRFAMRMCGGEEE
jgi:hypothetical protein